MPWPEHDGTVETCTECFAVLRDRLAAERVRGDQAEDVLRLLANPTDPNSPPLLAAEDYFMRRALAADPEGGSPDGA